MESQESVLESEGSGGARCVPSVSVHLASEIRRTLDPIDSGERVESHLFIVATTGQGDHHIDFAKHSAAPGTVLHIQPGQVHRWDRSASFEATIVVASPELCPPGLFSAADPRPEVPLGPVASVVGAVAADLVREAQVEKADRMVLIASTVLLMHHVSRAAATNDIGSSPAQAEMLRMFRAELEACYTVTRSVSDYARKIGTSTKTLTRATTGLVGVSPKELIDRRVVLEAQRLLAHSTESASSIGSTLGFSEPTNFTKYFARHTGSSPQEFRAGT